MASNYNTGISERDLDHLLGQAFLNLDFNDTKNEKMMEAIATQHLVNGNTFGGLVKKIFLNAWVIGFITAAVTGAIILAWFTQENGQTVIHPEIHTSPTPVDESPTVTWGSSNTPGANNAEPSGLPGGDTDKPDQDPGAIGSSILPMDKDNQNNQKYDKNGEIVQYQRTDSNYVFPALTEEEIKTNNKQKKKMITALVKMNKDKYTYIPQGTAEYRNKTISVNAFHMQTTEVSNLEYRTFLHDLLVQGRKEDYRLALPDNSMWIKRFPQATNEPMAELYFWHSAYDNYPVVNISREGAELYCKWLTTEANKVLKQNGKPATSLRLPGENEWVYAAMGGKNRVRYANAGTFLRNETGAYEVNYMGYPIEACRYDSIANIYLPANSKYSLFEDGGYYTVTTTSYFPNPYGLFCMAGNVTEMITTPGNQPSTKGGSWFSCDYFLEIEARDEFNGETSPSPMIGFRPVVTVPN